MMGQDAHHWVLLRQLKRAGLSTHAPPADEESWRVFLERVSAAYLESDKQQYLHDRAVEVSTREMASLYDELAQASELFIQCRSGVRSADIVRFLRTVGFTNVKNVKGGVLAWAREVDRSLPTY